MLKCQSCEILTNTKDVAIPTCLSMHADSRWSVVKMDRVDKMLCRLWRGAGDKVSQLHRPRTPERRQTVPGPGTRESTLRHQN